MKVNINWLLNHMISNRDVLFIKWEDAESPKKLLGTYYGYYQKEHPEIYSAEIDFFTIKDDRVEVYIK